MKRDSSSLSNIGNGAGEHQERARAITNSSQNESGLANQAFTMEGSASSSPEINRLGLASSINSSPQSNSTSTPTGSPRVEGAGLAEYVFAMDGDDKKNDGSKAR